MFVRFESVVPGGGPVGPAGGDLSGFYPNPTVVALEVSRDMNAETDRILNSSWWAQAIVQRHELDMKAKAEGRAHQMVDPDAHPPGPDHVMTPWAKAFIAERVKDGVLKTCTEGDEAQERLAVPHEEHLEQELHAAAHKLFSCTHNGRRTQLHDARAKLAKDDTAGHAQIEEGLAYVDRHIATVEAEVEAKRELDAKRVAEAETIVARQYDEHVEHYVSRVHGEILMHGLEPAPAEPPSTVIDAEKMLAEIDTAYAPYLEEPPSPAAPEAAAETVVEEEPARAPFSGTIIDDEE